ncbi:hypothetical protein [Psychroflexus sp. ALD_RP9]|uniref:hypothetical protein n=1 Tax=Psychroflexus sp. ALD_RP9 TaxID=2777186 RepID=UPI001A8EF9B7|nr:hypothetical protein [Psychroflexus sp. ALD_RP9]QSS97940.1 hypothetical protein IMZ30_04300 [Psychroflexus sp. ALD_RP9]
MKNFKRVFFSITIVLISLASSMQDTYAFNNSSLEIINNNAKNYSIYSSFRVEADLVSLGENSCFTVQVRVYKLNNEGQQFLVASDKVQICDDTDYSKSSSKANCSGKLPNGDLVMGVEDLGNPCLYQRLNNNKEIYDLYLDEIQEFKDKY